MSRELDRMRKQSMQKLEMAKQIAADTGSRTVAALNQMISEQQRVTEICHNAPAIIENLDKDFKSKTKLQDWDLVFLFLATAIQCTRQYLLTNDKFRLQDAGSKKANELGDELMEGVYDSTVGHLAPPSWKDVLFQPVPYDAITLGSHVSGTGLSGSTHRYRTLGHDPVLGWIFGTANIMTSSLTMTDLFTTYQVSGTTIIRRYPNGTMGMLNRTVQYAQQDPTLLAASLGRQAIHFGADYFTKQGLPLPFLGTLSPQAAHLCMNTSFKNPAHIDMWSVTRSAALAGLINHLVYCLHLLMYNEEKDGPRTLYEVRTRKILSYSNAMATGSNIIVTAMTKDAGKLDVGGMIVTIHRLLEDQKFIAEVKRDFLKNEIYKTVVGTEYDFMEGE